jgi:subtilisin family serine protease
MSTATRIALFTTVVATASAALVAPKPIEARRDIALPPGAVEQAFVENEILVEFDPAATSAARDVLLLKVGGQVVEVVHTAAMKSLGYPAISRVRTKIPVQTALERLAGSGAMRSAEPNFRLKIDAVSNDPYYVDKQLWGMYGAATSPANAFGIGAGTAWNRDKIGSANVVVGIIDQGIMHTHPDLAPNIWVNPYDPVDGIDNDGNGYVDDTRGWDFANSDNSIYDGPSDAHGTHVAGTIGAVGGNGAGVAGVCWKVTIIGAKFLGPAGGTTLGAIKAVDYFTDLKLRHGMNIVATNNSWSGGSYSISLDNAIKRANTANILFVAAAGNSSRNNDFSFTYPSNYPAANVIAVTSIGSLGELSTYSNYGKKNVDLGAPGSGIWSTVPTSTGAAGYASYGGTSMAAPHVTGAVALFAASRPAEATTAAAIKSAILGRTIPTSSLSGKTVTGGRLNVSGF